MSENSFLTEITMDVALTAKALARAGQNERLRNAILNLLREAEQESDDPVLFREQVRWPLVLGLLSNVKTHRVILENGLVFEASPDSRIEKALLLSADAHPDHVWEPQTTKLLVALSVGASHVIVGGAYSGDQVLFIARAMAAQNPPGVVHAFEPMAHTFRRLTRNVELNAICNVAAHRLGLWEHSGITLGLEGAAALASSVPIESNESHVVEAVTSISIDDYVDSQHLTSVGLIMLDTEGGEEKALLGARSLIARPAHEAPHLVFEIHRDYVDWSEGLQNTSIVQLLKAHGYAIFAIRDYHDNYRMTGRPIEIIPVECVYLEGPPHGFNLLATKQSDLISRLALRVVKNVSPKLILGKDQNLHAPLSD
jgi:FkbM family methyltransferase